MLFTIAKSHTPYQLELTTWNKLAKRDNPPRQRDNLAPESNNQPPEHDNPLPQRDKTKKDAFRHREKPNHSKEGRFPLRQKPHPYQLELTTWNKLAKRDNPPRQRDNPAPESDNQPPEHDNPLPQRDKTKKDAFRHREKPNHSKEGSFSLRQKPHPYQLELMNWRKLAN